MSGELKDVNIVAELTVGSHTDKVVVSQLSMTACVARLNFNVKAYQNAALRFYDNNQEGYTPYRSIKTTVVSIKRKKGDPSAYYANISFKGTVNASQGVVQLLSAKMEVIQENLLPDIDVKKNSLRIVLVKCNLCKQPHIPFWVLQSRSMLIKTNIFGVPCYVGTMLRRDFCDFNLLRMVTCPQCYFTSSELNDFEKEVSHASKLEPSFDVDIVSSQWEANISKRKQLVQSHIKAYFGEDRSFEQALLSYELGIMSSDEIFLADKDVDPRRRNYLPARQSILYLMFKSELLMTSNQPIIARKLLVEAVFRLEKIFPFLRHDASIRAGSLLGMIHLYLEDYKKVGQYLNFLRDFNKKGQVKEGTREYKTLSLNQKKLEEAYQNREEYSKKNLTYFQKPF